MAMNSGSVLKLSPTANRVRCVTAIRTLVFIIGGTKTQEFARTARAAKVLCTIFDL